MHFIQHTNIGAGNSVFPLLTANENPLLKLHACDYSSHAVKLVQQNPLYADPPLGSIRASVWDLTSDNLPDGIAPSSVDIVVLIFMLSALHPQEWVKAVANIYKMLKPSGYAVLRDYGRHDLAQLRFKEGRLLDDNFYIRGDKTRVYFFELDELPLLFSGTKATPAQKEAGNTEPVIEEETDDSGPVSTSSSQIHSPSCGTPTPADAIETTSFPLSPSESTVHPLLLDPLANAPSGCPAHPLFSVEQLGIDRRLIVNRKRQIKMYRVWMQGKFKKL